MLTRNATSTAAAAAAAIRKTTTMLTTRDMNSCTTYNSVNARNNKVDAVTETETETEIETAITTLKTSRVTKVNTKTTTTITSDPGILCFHHCNVKVFCFILPHICPQCKMALAAHPSGDAGTAAGIDASGYRSKNKNMMSLSKNNNNNSNNQNNKNNKNADQSLAIDSNKDDNDVGENGIYKHKQNHNDNDNDNNNDDNQANATCNTDKDAADNDLTRNSCTSNIMMASRLLPFRLPYPFVRANQYPCAIVLRPTTGDFLNDYNNTMDLHIAVTTSTGCVVEFDRHGLRRHRTDNMSEWWQCLLVGDVPEPWYDYWDQVLFEICQQPDKWTVSHYHEDQHNCYTFVLTFLQALTYDKLSEAATSKTKFCEKYIVPKTTTAGKYISLYRKLRDAGIYVHHTTNHHKVRGAKQQQQLQQRHLNKSNNLTTMTMTKNSLVTNKQLQQQQKHLGNQHNHHSITLRPHSTLCTIEE